MIVILYVNKVKQSSECDNYLPNFSGNTRSNQPME